MQFSPAHERALAQLANLWADRRFVVIGASAVQLQLTGFDRETRDLDVTLAVDVDDYPAGLESLAGWSADPQRTHTWLSPDAVQIDVLPVGPQAIAAGKIAWDTGQAMSVLGFRHVYGNTIPVRLGGGATIEVCRLHVIALLKMVAYLDRPSERGRDLADLSFLMDNYVDENSDRRFSDEVLAMGEDFEDVPSYLLGSDLKPLLVGDERGAAIEFLNKMETEAGIASFLRNAPRSWNQDRQIRDARLAALRRGAGFATPQ